MVLDSPFSDLVDLMMELVEMYRVRLPKFTVRIFLYKLLYYARVMRGFFNISFLVLLILDQVCNTKHAKSYPEKGKI